MIQDATFWDALAERYAAKPVDNPTAFERKQALTLRRMDRQQVVLDIGCGTGSLALILAPHAAHVHGLDFSGEMVRIARDKARDQGVDNVTFHVGPFDDTVPFEDASLDGLYAGSLLHLLPDRQDALARAYRLLRPGAWFHSSTVCLGESWVPYTPILAVMRWVGKAPPVWVISKDTLVQELEAAGFVDLQQPDVGAAATTAFVLARKPG